jgi:8-oxo-dGTP diphosphatase
MNNIPKVGLAVMILKKNEILLGKRIGSHGQNTWCFPGGHVEENETFVGCAHRENNEETGLKIKLIEPTLTIWTNDIFEKEKKHYHTFYIKAKHIFGEPQRLEPNKCLEWKWFGWDELVYEKRDSLFLPIQNLIKLGYNPFEK